MFNLEQAIIEWRQQMRTAGIETPVPLEELENHLREEIERQMRSGTDSKLAFESAVQKIGPASALKSEFKKVDAARKERDRALEQKVIFILANLISLMVCGIALFNQGSQMTSGQRLSCLAAAATFTLLVFTGRLGYRLFPVIRARRTRNFIGLGLGVLSLLWFMAFSYLILPHCEFNPGQIAVAYIWALSAPVGLHMGLALGIETAARKTNAMAVP